MQRKVALKVPSMKRKSLFAVVLLGLSACRVAYPKRWP